MVVGAVVGGLVLVMSVGGVLAWAGSERDLVALSDDCSAVVDDELLAEAFDGAVPELNGGFTTDEPDDLGLHGELRCSASHEGARLSVFVLLSDGEDEERLDGYYQMHGEPTGEHYDAAPAGELTEYDLGEGHSADVLWDEPSIGDRSVVGAMVDGSGDGGYCVMGSGQGAAWTRNAVIMVGLDNSMAPDPSGLDAEGLYDRVESLTAAVVDQVPRVAER